MQQYSNKFGFDVMSGFYFKNRHMRDRLINGHYGLNDEDEEVIALLGEDASAASVASAVHKESAHEDIWLNWLECGNLLRTHFPYARSILAASFASPIVSILEHINIYYHACGHSLTGKTALLRFAMSIWGAPDYLTFSYNATKAGLQNKAKMMDPLPLALDQLGFMVGKKKQLSAWVDMLTNPVSTSDMVSVLLSGEATIPDRSEYRNQNILSAGKYLISDIAPDQKGNPSLLEVKADPLPDTYDGRELGHYVWLTAHNNYYTQASYDSFKGGFGDSFGGSLVGLAGQKFLTFLKHLPDNPNSHAINSPAGHKTSRSIIVQALNAMIRTMKDELNVSFSARLDNASVLAVADYYSSLGVFGIEDEKTAWQEAVELGKKIIAAK